jgi:hypothetical protein
MDDCTERLSEIDRALGDALDVAESPDFAARVRRRIASVHTPAPVLRWRRIVMPAAAAAVVIVAAGAAVWRARPVEAPQPLPAIRLTLSTLRPAELPPAQGVSAFRIPARVSRPQAAAVTTAAHAEPEVLVPRAEIEMYRRLIAAAQNAPAAVVVEAPTDIAANQVIEEITLDPIKIDPLVPRVSAEGDRQ